MRILMRMGMSPFDNCSLLEIVKKDTIGTNSGNILFPYAIMRHIYQEGMEITPYILANPNDSEKINEKYDMYIIPLANAFRNTFVKELQHLTQLIKKLKIPCIVIGVGLQENYEPELDKKRSFDGVVKEFVEAVLEKSNSVGVRGEITATYLKNMGFKENAIRVIGCPSMFTCGKFLPCKRPFSLTPESTISINYHGNNDLYYQFIERTKEEFPTYYYVLQRIYELRLLYAGDTVPKEFCDNNYYIGTADSRSFLENRLRMFINVPSWINFLTKVDFTFGSCIHGNIASVLSGTPTLLFASDSRTRELGEYHNIPMKKMSDITEKTNLKSLYESLDFSSVLSGHENRYRTFINFLQENGIICDDVAYDTFNDFDRKMKQIPLNNLSGVSAYKCLPVAEQKKQLHAYLKICNEKIQWCKTNGDSKDSVNIKNLSSWEKSKACTVSNLEKLR